jgi:two-component system, chemotaxis family, chemotaxis protein CheY
MKHALVVDDSSVIRKIARKMLEELKFDVVEAEDAASAMKICNENLPDVILLDWNMPETSGLEFLIELRKMPRGGEPKVIFCTTENQQAKILSAMEAGADEYVMKPFNECIIREKLEQVGVLSS